MLALWKVTLRKLARIVIVSLVNRLGTEGGENLTRFWLVWVRAPWWMPCRQATTGTVLWQKYRMSWTYSVSNKRSRIICRSSSRRGQFSEHERPSCKNNNSHQEMIENMSLNTLRLTYPKEARSHTWIKSEAPSTAIGEDMTITGSHRKKSQ